MGHSLHRSVDWNLFAQVTESRTEQVTPYIGVWIEIPKLRIAPVTWNVTPYIGVWIEIDIKYLNPAKLLVTPYIGVWIEIYYYQLSNNYC